MAQGRLPAYPKEKCRDCGAILDSEQMIIHWNYFCPCSRVGHDAEEMPINYAPATGEKAEIKKGLRQTMSQELTYESRILLQTELTVNGRSQPMNAKVPRDFALAVGSEIKEGMRQNVPSPLEYASEIPLQAPPTLNFLSQNRHVERQKFASSMGNCEPQIMSERYQHTPLPSVRQSLPQTTCPQKDNLRFARGRNVKPQIESAAQSVRNKNLPLNTKEQIASRNAALPSPICETYSARLMSGAQAMSPPAQNIHPAMNAADVANHGKTFSALSSSRTTTLGSSKRSTPLLPNLYTIPSAKVTEEEITEAMIRYGIIKKQDR